MPEHLTNAAVVRRLRRYVRQSEILRQIHSDKAFRAARKGRWYAIVTVLTAAVVTLLGFAGPDRLAEAFLPGVDLDPAVLQVALSWTILAIATLALLGLVYRFDERSAQHHKSIERLTEFIRDTEDLAELSELGLPKLSGKDLTIFRERYKGIASSLPPSTDQEYRKSKKRYNDKKAGAVARPFWERTDSPKAISAEGTTLLAGWEGQPQSAILPDHATELVRFLSSGDRHEVLEIVRDELGGSFWLAGGFVRDIVWDNLSAHPIATPLEDIDVVYFDADRPQVDDRELGRTLTRVVPTQNWSVVNQAHAHTRSGEARYESLLDAVAHFPETASAVAVQLSESNTVRIMAPYGLKDLLDGVVRQSSRAKPTSFDARLRKKEWTAKWPAVRLVASAIE